MTSDYLLNVTVVSITEREEHSNRTHFPILREREGMAKFLCINKCLYVIEHKTIYCPNISYYVTLKEECKIS